MTEEDNEKRVRAFYEATVPGDRESLRGLHGRRIAGHVECGCSSK
jgi:hypothetical protein